MSLKSFLKASLIIHFAGAVILYFYYNPISLHPTPVYKEKEDSLKSEENQKELEVLEKKPEKTVKAFVKGNKARKLEQINVRKKLLAESLSKDKDMILKPEQVEEVESDEIAEEKPAERLKEDLIGKESMEINLEDKIEKEEFQDFSLLKQKTGNPPLSYPNFARKKGLQGTVSLLFFVDERGLVEKLQLESSSGHPDLDNFVLRRLSHYQFLENQKGWFRFKKTFVLKGKEPEYLRLRQADEFEKGELEEPIEKRKPLEDSKPQFNGEEERIEEELESAESVYEEPEIEFIEYEN